MDRIASAAKLVVPDKLFMAMCCDCDSNLPDVDADAP
jgi:hypothetical protein